MDNEAFATFRSLLNEPDSTLNSSRVLERLTVWANRPGELDPRILAYVKEHLAHRSWEDDVWLPPDLWAEWWKQGSRLELLDVCPWAVGSMYVWTRGIYGDYGHESRMVWSQSLSALCDQIHAHCDEINRDPVAFASDVSGDRRAFWVTAPNLVVLWAGVSVQTISLREALYWERIGPWSDVRCTRLLPEPKPDEMGPYMESCSYLYPSDLPVEWRGLDANGERVDLSWETLDAILCQAQPGDFALRFDPPDTILHLRGAPQLCPLSMDEDAREFFNEQTCYQPDTDSWSELSMLHSVWF